MIRTQVQLTEQQARRLKRLAAERNVSMASLIREAIDRLDVEGDPAAGRDRALSVVGKFRDLHGAHDVSGQHDRYLEEAARP